MADQVAPQAGATKVNEMTHRMSKTSPTRKVARPGSTEDCAARCRPRISTQIMKGLRKAWAAKSPMRDSVLAATGPGLETTGA